jgi:hypothetical protein
MEQVTRFFENNKRATAIIWTNRIQGIDRSQADIDFEKNISYYKSIKLGSSTDKAVCSIIHIRCLSRQSIS